MIEETVYQLDGELHRPEDTDYQAWLADVHTRHRRPRCMCAPGDDGLGLDMYVANIRGTYVIKRMPNTAYRHTSGCIHYELPELLSGESFAQRAISEDPETGVTKLKVGFSLAHRTKVEKESDAETPASKPSKANPTVKRTDAKLSLAGALHHLYKEARFNTWSPRMKGKRNYALIQHYLSEVVARTNMGKDKMSDRFYMPPPWRQDLAEDNTRVLNRFIWSIAPKEHAKETRLGVIVGLVKSVTETSVGSFRVALKHTKQAVFIDGKMWEKLCKTYPTAESLLEDAESHIFIVATVSCSIRQNLTVEEAALMATDNDWLPIHGFYGMQLLNELKERYFHVPLRFDLSPDNILPDVVLTDTEKPTAVYVYQQPTEPDEREAVIEMYADLAGEGNPYIWFVADGDPLELPPSIHFQSWADESPVYSQEAG